MKRSMVVAVTGLALAGCPRNPPETTTSNPPAQEPAAAPAIPELPPTNPPLPEPPVGNPPPPSALPTWESVLSGHPQGATNPPFPELLVMPDGRCFKHWRSPMDRRQPVGDRVVTECPPDACGTEVQCPPQAAGLLEAWKSTPQ